MYTLFNGLLLNKELNIENAWQLNDTRSIAYYIVLKHVMYEKTYANTLGLLWSLWGYP